MGVDILGIDILGVDIPALPNLSIFCPFYLLSSYVLSYPDRVHVCFCNWRDFTFNLSSKEQTEIENHKILLQNSDLYTCTYVDHCSKRVFITEFLKQRLYILGYYSQHKINFLLFEIFLL